MSKTIFLTGGTGFLGSYLGYQFLTEGHHVIFLARASKDQSAEERIREKISYLRNVSSQHPKKFGSWEVIEGNIDRKNLDLSVRAIQKLQMVDEVWHLAASLGFRKKEQSRNQKTNITGTKNLFTFTETLRVERIFHISTAYIIGKDEFLPEAELQKKPQFNNTYEETKFLGEQFIYQWVREHKGMPRVVIFRPSIIVGTRTITPSRPFGYYSFLAALEKIRKVYPFNFIPIPFFYPVNRFLNIISIDDAACLMLAVARVDTGAQKLAIYNIVNPNPPTFDLIFRETFRAYNFTIPLIGISPALLPIFFKIVFIISKVFSPLRPLSIAFRFFGFYLVQKKNFSTDKSRRFFAICNFDQRSIIDSKRLHKNIIRGFQELWT